MDTPRRAHFTPGAPTTNVYINVHALQCLACHDPLRDQLEFDKSFRAPLVLPYALQFAKHTPTPYC
jgi:hypothetical protein